VRIDRTHRGWAWGTGIAIAFTALAYAAYASRTPGGPSGGSALGLAYGAASALMILFAAALSIRKKALLARFGSLTWWMRGHLWLGLLALPVALFHSAFAFGGWLTTILMWLLIIVVVSGLIGAALQHTFPGVITAQVNEEHTFEQMDRMRLSLRREAFELVAASCGSVEAAADERDELIRTMGHPPKEPKKVSPQEGSDRLADVYVNTVVPFLRNGADRATPLAHAASAALLFEDLRPRVHADLHPAIDDLASICESLRQQARQTKLHNWLHGWLLLHIPLSMALIVLMLVHAVMALYY
jgi:hypothetical protein